MNTKQSTRYIALGEPDPTKEASIRQLLRRNRESRAPAAFSALGSDPSGDPASRFATTAAADGHAERH